MKILKKLHMEHLNPMFVAEKISPDVVCKLSLEEFKQLGLVNHSDIMKLRVSCSSYGGFRPIRDQKTAGSPKFVIPKHLLENLMEEGFTIKEISRIISVSERTVYRRMLEYDLSKRDFTPIDDDQLDSEVLKLTKDYPFNGEVMLNELLKIEDSESRDLV